MSPNPSRALVIVLGDLERSPRMLRHAQSLSRIGCFVDLLGFGGKDLLSDGIANRRTRVLRLASFDRLRASRIPSLVLAAALLRQIVLAVALTIALARLRRPHLVLVQNPPAFPAMPILLFFAAIWRAHLIVDWHNFTSAMLRLRLAGRWPLLIRLVERMEVMFARRADEHFAASQALADRLDREWRIRAVVVPDRATTEFVPRGRDSVAMPTIIAPTSWGDDEDFSLLTEAALLCEHAGLRLQFVVTGKGEHRARYERTFAEMPQRLVSIRTEWFAADAYPRALASADLGLSLHRSASGVDLPAKVPEMLACGIPVCAFDCGPALREQLREGEDGLFFSSATELAAILRTLCATWPHAPELDRLRASVRAYERPRWDQEWDHRVRPIIENVLAC